MAVEEVRKAVRYGTSTVDWQGRLDAGKMRQDRFEKTQVAMKENGIAAMLCLLPENKRYATGCRAGIHTGAAESCALVFAEGPIANSIVYEEGSVWVPEHEHITWLKPENHRPFHQHWSLSSGPGFYAWWVQEFAKTIYEDLKAMKVEKEKLGIDAGAEVKAALRELGVNVVDAFEIMMNTRIIKTEDEIYCMKMAGAIVDIAYAEMIEFLRSGRRENEVSAVGLAALRRNGIEGNPGVSVRSGPNTAPNYLGRMPTDRIIQPGDLVYWDIFGARYLGYCTCYYRTFKVGSKPTQQEKDWYKRTRDMLYDAVAVLKDGVTSADVAEKWPKASYFGRDHEMKVCGDALGHGQGLSLYEYPLITRDNALRFPQPIKENMTIAMETWFGQDDPEHGWRGGCRLENVWRVTKNGHENLYAMPDDDIILPPHSIYQQ